MSDTRLRESKDGKWKVEGETDTTRKVDFFYYARLVDALDDQQIISLISHPKITKFGDARTDPLRVFVS